MTDQKNIFQYLRIITGIALLLIILTSISCVSGKRLSGSSQVVTPVSDTVRLRNGSLVYALPRTIFTVRVEFERTIEIPGPYAAYAEDLLGMKDVIKNEGEYWSVKSVSVNSHEEADPSEYYVIESNNLYQSNVLSLKKEGLILDLNPELNYQSDSHITNKELNINQFRSFDLGSDEYYEIQSDTAFRRVKIDSLFIRIPYIVEKKKKLTDDQLAERAAKRLTELRDGKIMILTGEANVFPQNDASINEINRMINDYTELFSGKSLTEIRSFTYEFVPGKENTTNFYNLFMFSETTGPSDRGTETGIPVKIELIPEQKTKDITLISSGEAQGGETSNDKLFYRIPDIALIKISMGDKTLYSSRKLVYQLGEVVQIPGNFVISR